MSRFALLAAGFGQALLLAVAIGAPICLLLWRAGRGRAAPLVLACLFAVGLGQAPLPDPRAMDCARGAEVHLVPFGQFAAEAAAAARGGGWAGFLTGLTFLSTVLNVAMFAPAGAALRLVTGRRAAALALGLALPAVIESAQGTGIYGLYPCGWRTVDATDFVTNAAGVMLGFLMASRLRLGSGPA